MTNLLIIHSSPDTENSVSRYLSKYFRKCFEQQFPKQPHIVERDLIQIPPPHLTKEYITILNKPSQERTEEEAQQGALADAMIQELIEADIVVVGCPMYNFSIPSQLKSYFDHVAKKNVTFRITPSKEKEGLLKNKTAYILLASGGDYSTGSSHTSQNFASTYIKTFFQFLGFNKVNTIYCPHLTAGTEARNNSIHVACEAILISIRSLAVQQDRDKQ